VYKHETYNDRKRKHKGKAETPETKKPRKFKTNEGRETLESSQMTTTRLTM